MVGVFWEVYVKQSNLSMIFTNISGLNLYEKQIEKRNIMFVGTRLGQTKLTLSCHFWLQKFNAKLGLSFKYLFYIDIFEKKKKKKRFPCESMTMPWGKPHLLVVSIPYVPILPVIYFDFFCTKNLPICYVQIPLWVNDNVMGYVVSPPWYQPSAVSSFG